MSTPIFEDLTFNQITRNWGDTPGCHDCPNPAVWRFTRVCCKRSRLVCTDHMEAVLVQLDRVMALAERYGMPVECARCGVGHRGEPITWGLL